MRTLSVSRLFVTLSAIFLGTTAYIAMVYGPRAYFIEFGRPMSPMAFLQKGYDYKAPTLPTFVVTSAITSPSATAGDIETMTVTAKADQTTTGYLEVWITAPNHKQVFKNKLPAIPETFIAGQSHTYAFSYTLPATLPAGTYTVSDLITSSNHQTDYYVNEDFATFQLV